MTEQEMKDDAYQDKLNEAKEIEQEENKDRCVGEVLDTRTGKTIRAYEADA